MCGMCYLWSCSDHIFSSSIALVPWIWLRSLSIYPPVASLVVVYLHHSFCSYYTRQYFWRVRGGSDSRVLRIVFWSDITVCNVRCLTEQQLVSFAKSEDVIPCGYVTLVRILSTAFFISLAQPIPCLSQYFPCPHPHVPQLLFNCNIYPKAGY